jgi:hypothetical protein
LLLFSHRLLRASSRGKGVISENVLVSAAAGGTSGNSCPVERKIRLSHKKFHALIKINVTLIAHQERNIYVNSAPNPSIRGKLYPH